MAEWADPGRVDLVDPDREALLDALVRHEVQFVLIGGAAIQSHGRRYDTLDVDVTPSAEDANLIRLAAALNELECRLVTDPADTSAWVAVPAGYFSARTLRAAQAWNLATRHGQLDLSFTPSGFPSGFAELARERSGWRPPVRTSASSSPPWRTSTLQSERPTAQRTAPTSPKSTHATIRRRITALPLRTRRALRAA